VLAFGLARVGRGFFRRAVMSAADRDLLQPQTMSPWIEEV